jgi:hypothetical protein
MKTNQEKETEAILAVFDKLHKLEKELEKTKQRVQELEYQLEAEQKR